MRELRDVQGLARGPGRQERREPLDDLADRARREQPHRGAAEKLAEGLGVTLASLFDAPAAAPAALRPGGAARRPAPVAATRPRATFRRNVSPPGVPQPMQIVEVQFPPRRPRAFENGAARRPRPPADLGPRGRRSTSRWARRDIACTKATAWPWCSTTRPCSTTRTERPTRYAVIIAMPTDGEETMRCTPQPGPFDAAWTRSNRGAARRPGRPADRLRRGRRVGQLHAAADARAGAMAFWRGSPGRGARASARCWSPRTRTASAAPCS